MAFTYDLNTSVGITRFRIGDTVQGDGPRPDRRNFSDDEIQAMLDQGGSVDAALGLLQAVLSNEWASVPDFTIGDRKESFSQVHRAYSEAAQESGVGSHITFTGAFVRKDAYSKDE